MKRLEPNFRNSYDPNTNRFLFRLYITVEPKFDGDYNFSGKHKLRYLDMAWGSEGLPVFRKVAFFYSSGEVRARYPAKEWEQDHTLDETEYEGADPTGPDPLICKPHNDQEWLRLHEEMQPVAGIPAEGTVRYLEAVRAVFADWYKWHNLAPPSMRLNSHDRGSAISHLSEHGFVLKKYLGRITQGGGAGRFFVVEDLWDLYESREAGSAPRREGKLYPRCYGVEADAFGTFAPTRRLQGDEARFLPGAAEVDYAICKAHNDAELRRLVEKQRIAEQNGARDLVRYYNKVRSEIGHWYTEASLPLPPTTSEGSTSEHHVGEPILLDSAQGRPHLHVRRRWESARSDTKSRAFLALEILREFPGINNRERLKAALGHQKLFPETADPVKALEGVLQKSASSAGWASFEGALEECVRYLEEEQGWRDRAHVYLGALSDQAVQSHLEACSSM